MGRGLIGMLAAAVDVDVEWRAPLPDGPKIICSNHPTTTDPFLLLAQTLGRVHILITHMAFDVAVLGRGLRASGHVTVVDGNGRAAFDAARELLEAGESIAIYPEGALSPLEGGFGRPHTGAARLSLLTGAPIVPVGVALDRERIRFVDTTVADKTERARWYLHGPYRMTFGEAIWPIGDVEDWAVVRARTGELMAEIGRLERISAARLPARQPSLSDRIAARVAPVAGWRPRLSLEMPDLSTAALRGIGSQLLGR